MVKNEQENAYYLYLIEKQKEFNTPTSIVDQEIKKASGSSPVSKSRLIEGEVNEVYDVVTENGQNIIVRISRKKHSTFQAEQWSINEARKVAVPAPDILLIDEIETETGNLIFLVERKIEGISLEKLLDLIKAGESTIDARQLTIKAGGILSQLHTISVPRIGRLDRDPKNAYRSWTDYMLRIFEREPEVTQKAIELGFNPDSVGITFDLIRKSTPLFDLKEPKLLHGDFSAKHILVNGAEVSGIIDFENSMGGDPIYDFAWMNYFYDKDVPLEYLMEGYQNKEIFDEEFTRKINLYKIIFSLGFIDYFESMNNPIGLNRTKLRYERDLRYLQP